MVFAHTTVEAPKYGARRRAAAISLPRLAQPATKTTTASGGRATARSALSSGASGAVKVERDRVDAPALPGRARAVVEHVAEVRAAAAAQHLRAGHPVGVVLARLDRLGDRRLGEARPAGAGVELRVRAEQLVAAGGAAVYPVFLRVGVLASERRLRAVPAQHLVLLRRELLAPLVFALLDLGFHLASFRYRLRPTTSPKMPTKRSATGPMANSRSTLARPARPIAARSSVEAASTRSSAALSTSTRPGATRKPDSPSSTSSGMPAMCVDTTGRPVAMASISTTGMPSAKLGIANTSA